MSSPEGGGPSWPGDHRPSQEAQPRNTVSMDSVFRNQSLEDEITVLQAEQQIEHQISNQLEEQDSSGSSIRRSRSRRADVPEDEFDIATKLPTERGPSYQPSETQATFIARMAKHIHTSFWLIRYFIYITPIAGVLLVPILLGALLFPNTLVGGVYLEWFGIWLEIIWLTLWAGRILAKIIPWPAGVITSMFTDASKKWRDMGKQLEIPLTLFFWWLAVEVSFLPVMTLHTAPGYNGDQSWLSTVNKIIICIFAGTTLNLAEKIIIQLIAISFHTRTYQDRITTNNTIIGIVIHLYTHSKSALSQPDEDFEDKPGHGSGSGARTPIQYVEKAQKNLNSAIRKTGDAAAKMAADFTGRKGRNSSHPSQVVLLLLNSEKGCKVLARRLFHTFEHKYETEKDQEAEEHESAILPEDLQSAFVTPNADPEQVKEAASEAFAVFDRDLNGDIAMNELELAITEAGQERKSILASLKDLDTVVSKLDYILIWVVAIVVLLIFLSLISTSAAGVLTSAGSTVLALSWLFSTSAQEFLASLIFVFIKHPFDVGDRVSIYGNTGSTLKGDDYFVKEVSLLYTEFKKMEGQIVQAPNSYLNTLFIMNMRRSGGLAEAVPISVKFGTSIEQIDSLRQSLVEFVQSEPREYQGKILTEVRDIVNCWTVNVNVIFFYKTNWQNELLRLRRRNKFICMLMHFIYENGIESPQMLSAGYSAQTPLYLNYNAIPPAYSPRSGHDDQSGPEGRVAEQPRTGDPTHTVRHQTSILRRPSNAQRSSRSRGESVSSIAKHVDFTLGADDAASDVVFGDVHEETPQERQHRMVRRDVSRTRVSTIAEEGEREALLGRSSAAGSSATESSPAAGGSSHRNRFLSLAGRHRAASETVMMEGGMGPARDRSVEARGSRAGPPDGRLQ